MIIKILGILDLLSAAIFWLFSFFNFFESAIILISLYLIAKGAGFALTSHDPISFLDIIAGAIIFTSISVQMPAIITILVIIYLIQKGIFSLL